MAFDSEITTKSRDLIVLEDARERIARGWCQGRIYKDGNVCMVGAFHNPKDDHGYLNLWSGRAYRIANLLGFDDAGQMEGWNDSSFRSKAEVLARFDAAIAKLSAEG